MIHHRLQSVANQRSWIVATLASTTLVVIGALLLHRQPAQPNSNVVTDDTAISTVAADGTTLRGSIHFPTTPTAVPGIILLHDLGADRTAWNSHSKDITDAGYAVVQVDIRGFGKSAVPNTNARSESYFTSMVTDIQSWVAELKKDSRLDPQKISVIGVGLGANIAYSAARYDVIHRTVILSPTITPATQFAPTTTPAMRGVYGIATTPDETKLRSLMAAVGEPKKITIVTGDGHGMELVTPAMVTEMLNWLAQ